MHECRKNRDGKTGMAMNARIFAHQRDGVRGQRHLRNVELAMPQHPEKRLLDVQVQYIELDAIGLDAAVGECANAIVVPARQGQTQLRQSHLDGRRARCNARGGTRKRNDTGFADALANADLMRQYDVPPFPSRLQHGQTDLESGHGPPPVVQRWLAVDSPPHRVHRSPPRAGSAVVGAGPCALRRHRRSSHRLATAADRRGRTTRGPCRNVRATPDRLAGSPQPIRDGG